MKKIRVILLFLWLFFVQQSSLANIGTEWYDAVWTLINDQYIDKTYNNQEWNTWKHKYDGLIETEDDAYIAVSEMLASLNDNYTYFLLPNDFKAMTESFSGKAEGFGFSVKQHKNGLKIKNIIKNSPAEKVGLQIGDVILAINGVELEGLESEQKVDNFAEKNTLLVKRKGAEPKDYIVSIEEYELDPVSTELLVKSIVVPEDFLYARIESFANKLSAQNFYDLFKSRNVVNGIIIDLRGNSGGYVDRAATIANMFLQDTTIVTTVDRDGNEQPVMANNHLLTDVPIVVLIDKNSASASEIFAAAMQDNKRAKIVGTTSFGKGIVQKYEALPNGAGLNFTVKKYLTPNRKDIHKKGVEPDYVIKNYPFSRILKNDPQLEFAINLLENCLK